MPTIATARMVGEVRIDGDEEAKRKLESVDKKVKETGEGFTGMLKKAVSFAAGRVLFTGVSDAIGFLRSQITDTIKVTEDHQLVAAQTVQVLKSTKDVSGETALQIEQMAQGWSRYTPFAADAIQNTENLLLTFTNISKKGGVFDDTTQAVLDVSQAMGQDLKSSAIQVGKALGDPLTGMTALQRIGVTFSKEEKDAVKTMMAHNDIIGAQKIILHELSTEFGGSATAASKTFGGQMAIMGHQFEDMKIQIGTALLPILGDLINKYVRPLISTFNDWMFNNGGLQAIQNIVKQIADFMTTTFLPALGNLLNTYIIPLATQMYDLFIKSGWVHDALKTIGDVIGYVGPFVFGLVTNVGNLIGWFQKSGPQGTILKDALLGVAGGIAAIKITDMIGDFMKWVTDTVPQIMSKIGQLTGINGFGGIGPAADTAAAEVQADSLKMETSIGGVITELSGLGGIALLATQAVQNQISQAATQTDRGYDTSSKVQGEIGQVWNDINKANMNAGLPPKTLDDFKKLPKQIQQAFTQDWLKMFPGELPPFTTVGAMASGGTVGTSGWYNFMEQGPEGVIPGGGSPAYLPAGTRVIPNTQLGSSSNGAPMTFILQVDGYQLASIVTQYQPGVIRNGVGLVGV